MTSRGTWRVVRNRGAWLGRRDAGRAHLKSARNALELADDGDDGRLMVQGAILAAIAFGDALTMRIAGVKNASDHQRLVDTLKHALGKRVPPSELTRLDRLLQLKDDSAYGHRPMSLDEARTAIAKAEGFASWAEIELARG